MQASFKYRCLLVVLLALVALAAPAFAQSVGHQLGTPGGPFLDLNSACVVAPQVPNQLGSPGDPFPPSSEVSDQKVGSVLVYNLYTSVPSSLSTNDTLINITNTNQSFGVAVHVFFIDGCTCNVLDLAVFLTKNQTASFRASDIDPGTMGYIVAVASNPTTGAPINFNFLMGSEYVRANRLVDCTGRPLRGNFQAFLGAESFAALGGSPGTGTVFGTLFDQSPSSTTTIRFDGISYNRAPRVLAADGILSPADGNNMLLVINSLNGDLSGNVRPLPNLFAILFDDQENGFSFNIPGNRCQIKVILGGLRIGNRIASASAGGFPSGRAGWMNLFMQGAAIPKGRTGWAKVDTQTGGVGSEINAGTTTQMICGVVTAFTPATADTAGSITINGMTFTITAGTTITGTMIPTGTDLTGVNLCLNLTLDANGNIIAPSSATTNPPPPTPGGNAAAIGPEAFNPPPSTPLSFSGGRNLHKLTLTSAAGFTIPVFPLDP